MFAHWICLQNDKGAVFWKRKKQTGIRLMMFSAETVSATEKTNLLKQSSGRRDKEIISFAKPDSRFQ